MYWNNRGFSFIEIMAACSIFFMIMFTFIPIIYQIKTEENILLQRRLIQIELFNDLQAHIHNSNPEATERLNKKINGIPVQLKFSLEEQLQKGCITWTNLKNKKESFCLYGYPD